MYEKSIFSRKKRFHPFERHFYQNQNWRAEFMLRTAGRLVFFDLKFEAKILAPIIHFQDCKHLCIFFGDKKRPLVAKKFPRMNSGLIDNALTRYS